MTDTPFQEKHPDTFAVKPVFDLFKQAEEQMFSWKTRGGIGWVAFVLGIAGGGCYLSSLIDPSDQMRRNTLVFSLMLLVIVGFAVLSYEQYIDGLEKRTNLEFARKYTFEVTRLYIENQTEKGQVLTPPNLAAIVQTVSSQVFSPDPTEKEGLFVRKQ